MVRADIVTSKLADLGVRIARVRARTPATAALLRDDQDALDLVSFNLMLCVQSAADIASHIVADEGWRPAVTLADAFERLQENGVITRPTADAMGKAAGLRNVVAHGYSGVDIGMVFAAASRGVADLEAFAAEVASWLRQRIASPA
jgi:uncharacterized protein YutE (UPF0331/DUF86 family)